MSQSFSGSARYQVDSWISHPVCVCPRIQMSRWAEFLTLAGVTADVTLLNGTLLKMVMQHMVMHFFISNLINITRYLSSQ